MTKELDDIYKIIDGGGDAYTKIKKIKDYIITYSHEVNCSCSGCLK